MARVFAYLMSSDLPSIEDERIFKDTSKTIRDAMVETFEKNNKKTEIARSAFEIALNKLI